MRSKLFVLGLTSLLLAVWVATDWWSRLSPESRAVGILVAPATIGAWQRTDAGMAWHSGAFQENLQYSKNALILNVSVDHNGSREMNAALCFVGRGGALKASKVSVLQSLGGPARFNVGWLDSDSSLTVVAATQCRADSCVENSPAPTLRDLGHLRFWRELVFPTRPPSLPVNISVALEHSVANEARFLSMESDLVQFVSNLDLRPVQQKAESTSR